MFTIIPESVKTKANEMNQIASEIQTLLDRSLVIEFDNLHGSWKSNAATEYMKQFEELRATFKNFYGQIQSFAASVNQLGNEANAADEASNIRS